MRVGLPPVRPRAPRPRRHRPSPRSASPTCCASRASGPDVRIAVLKGGRSLERQVSLRSGARVQDALERLGHDVAAIDVGGDLVERLRDTEPEIAFIALHGRDGEDGTVQELLDALGIAY